MEVLVFDAPHFSRIGWVPTPGAPKAYCCDATAAAAGVCTVRNTLIVRPDRSSDVGGDGLHLRHPISNFRVKLPAGGQTVRVRQQRDIKVG